MMHKTLLAVAMIAATAFTLPAAADSAKRPAAAVVIHVDGGHDGYRDGRNDKGRHDKDRHYKKRDYKDRHDYKKHHGDKHGRSDWSRRPGAHGSPYGGGRWHRDTYRHPASPYYEGRHYYNQRHYRDLGPVHFDGRHYWRNGRDARGGWVRLAIDPRSGLIVAVIPFR
ncbi:hypothetical protein [Oceanibacterium hippocampi]|uniref:Nickel/cobalt homeostasis protein RcnB n=1 Tax=Oceanibacterium hippocampi TaxID=745714 RepID=A0A1Y5TDY8_9PROT|nr:hypothetical protein [Oceanibacterium hippocampi]SLN59787.1 hypothetical protein OCH7691_02633 [Oceanibacterium hippocampi]